MQWLVEPLLGTKRRMRGHNVPGNDPTRDCETRLDRSRFLLIYKAAKAMKADLKYPVFPFTIFLLITAFLYQVNFPLLRTAFTIQGNYTDFNLCKRFRERRGHVAPGSFTFSLGFSH